MSVIFYLLIFTLISLLLLFRVPDRGSGNPTPLGGWMAALPV
jgi:hypothetical protein